MLLRAKVTAKILEIDGQVSTGVDLICGDGSSPVIGHIELQDVDWELGQQLTIEIGKR